MTPDKKLLLLLSSLLVIGFLATSTTSFLVSRKSLRAELETNTLPLTSDNIYSEIQRDLLRPVFISSLMASDTFMRDWILTGEENPLSITKYLKEIQKKYMTHTAFLVSESTKTYYHADGILKSISPEQPRDAWYFRVRGMSEEYEINVDPDLANRDTLTIFVNYRVYDYAGEYIGATGVGLSVNAVKKRIEDYQQKYGRNIIFVTTDGQIQLTGSDFPDAIPTIFARPNFPALDLKNITNDGVYRYTDGNRLIFGNIRYIPEFDWFLLVEQAEPKTTRQFFSALALNLLIFLLITAIVIFLVNLTIRLYKKRIETLRGIVPICSYCKQIRDDQGYWNQVEAYVARHTEAEFSHGICPGCMEKNFPQIRGQ